MVQSAAAPGQELADAVIGAEWLKQFDFAAANLQQRGFDPLLLDGGAAGELQARAYRARTE